MCVPCPTKSTSTVCPFTATRHIQPHVLERVEPCGRECAVPAASDESLPGGEVVEHRLGIHELSGFIAAALIEELVIESDDLLGGHAR